MSGFKNEFLEKLGMFKEKVGNVFECVEAVTIIVNNYTVHCTKNQETKNAKNT